MIKLTPIAFFTLLFVNVAFSLDYDGVSEHCLTDRDRGEVCSNGTKPEIMYHFDKFTKRCLPFKFNGCGGNDNRFKTDNKCYFSCLPADYESCAFSTDPLKNEKGEDVLCGPAEGLSVRTQECPTDYECVMFYPVGRCCQKKSEELLRESFNTKCPKGESTLLGKSCDDDFCPSDQTCHQGDIFAHCCPK
uniref:BPTI/Kunitz inhibitor domain-containing protein n=1 Tax=Panagrellus redivivus TaxID=6233 RepID=A0A7E4V1T0_PANRE